MMTKKTGEEGLGLLIAIIGLSIFSLLGLYMSFNATTEVRISDNYETEIRAASAAQAGINHVREALRGIRFDYHLLGPNGAANTSLTTARSFAFRNPLPWALARSVNVDNPAADIATLADDGIINTGKYGGTNGTSIVPITGIAETVPNPYGAGTITISRYFVKVTDNNGEASEIAGDGADNPFVDGDNIIVVRSMGISRTIREDSGGAVRRNSVAVYEARFRMRTTFDLDAPLVVEGSDVQPSGPMMWDGAAFNIDGGNANLGLATIDTDLSDGISPEERVSATLDKNQERKITGTGPSPSIDDITASVAGDADKSLLMDPEFLWNFVHNVIPLHADNVFYGDQQWSGSNCPDLGQVDYRLPDTDLSQNPKITFVDGNLDIGGQVSGGGVLVVTGMLNGNGSMTWNGLILVLGQGEVDGSGLNIGLHGGMLVANVQESNGVASFGTPKFTWRGNSNIVMNDNALSMSVRLLPLEQIGWREVNSTMDP